VIFQVTSAGRLFGYRFYQSNVVLQPHWAVIGVNDPVAVLSVHHAKYVAQSVDGWQQVWIRPTVKLVPGVNYRLAVLFPQGNYFRQNNGLTASPVTHNGISFIQSFQTTSLEPITAGVTINLNANGVDVLFQSDT
jgi:hypothetical protein